jgi:class 3 adenylate cyclase
VLGVPIEWEETAFEWIIGQRFGVERIYQRGPLARMVVQCELVPSANGGTVLTYAMTLTPAGWLGRLSAPFAIGRRAAATMERVFRQYDAFAREGLRQSRVSHSPKLAEGAEDRLRAISRRLVETQAQPRELVAKLELLLKEADDLSVARLRPYALAAEWKSSRRDTLHLFLHATRAGLLDFTWELVCPHCRGAKAGPSTLAGLSAEAHCDSCGVDFTANFDQSIELTFRPNPAIRTVSRPMYCVGGPQITPHIVAQQRVAGGEARDLTLAVAPGRYRVRRTGIPRQATLRVAEGGQAAVRVEVGAASSDEPTLAPAGTLTLVNTAPQATWLVVEHLAWTDDATTAADVTSLQLFRDLFSREVLRPGERISVGSLTVVFTDLKNSTQLYQEIGDAPAFGRVLTHFELLKAVVAEENGAIVKTMGDAIMAVFPRPIAAVRAMRHAQRWLADPARFALPEGVTVPPSSLQPLALKAGIHTGSCLAITQNDRLDYFGTTVNAAARLCAQCTGTDIVLSEATANDAEVAAWLRADKTIRCQREHVALKGFGATLFEQYRVARPFPYRAGEPPSVSLG